jgi:hypothetical protein
MISGLRRLYGYAARLPRAIRIPAAVFLATRVGIVMVAYLSVPTVADNPGAPPYHLRGTDNLLVDVFGSRWDTGFYVSIVDEGYKYEGVDLPSVPFFPLLPLVMRALLPLTGDAVTAGILAANLALLGAAVLFYRLVDGKWGPATADRAVWYLLIFPVSFFGSAIYSESLFLLAAIAALLFARRGRWGAAAAAGFLAGLSRFLGLIVAPLLFIEWLVRRRGPEADRPPWSALLSSAAVPLGTLAYMGYLQMVFGDALAFKNGSAAWGREPASPVRMIADLFAAPEGGWVAALTGGGIHLDNWTDFLFVLAFLVMGVVLLAKREWAEGVFVLLGTLIPLSSGLWMSQRRYMWVLFPAFILLARWGERPWVDRTVTAVSLALLGYFTVLFANGYWVG